MDAETTLRGLIRRALPDSVVTVTRDTQGYRLAVKSARFGGVRADNQATVYAALDAAPVTLLARVHTIACSN